MSTSIIRQFARELAGLREEVRSAILTPQLSNSSIENGGYITVNTGVGEAATAVLQIGGQFDGAYSSTSLTGPTPPTPTAGVLSPIPGGFVDRWDGLFIDSAFAPTDYSRVEVHVGDSADFDTSFADTIKGTIETPRGTDVIVTGLDAGIYYVKHVARSLSGKRGPDSPVASVSVLPAPTEQSVTDAQNAADAAAQTATQAALDAADAAANAALAEAVAEDAALAAVAAQATADLKGRDPFVQAEAPTGLNSTSDIGTIWYDSDDGHKMWRWTAGPSAPTWEPIIAGSQFFSDTIVGKTITGAAISGSLITGSTLQTSTTGAGWELSSDPADAGTFPGVYIDGYSGHVNEYNPGFLKTGFWIHVEGGVEKESPFLHLQSPTVETVADPNLGMAASKLYLYGANQDGDEAAIEHISDRHGFFVNGGGTDLSIYGPNGGVQDGVYIISRPKVGGVDGPDWSLLNVNGGTGEAKLEGTNKVTLFSDALTLIDSNTKTAIHSNGVVELQSPTKFTDDRMIPRAAATAATFSPRQSWNGYPDNGSTLEFDAPPSGKIQVVIGGFIKAVTAGQAAVIGFLIKGPDDVTFLGYHLSRAFANYSTTYIGTSRTVLVSGLTPDTHYLIYHWMVCGAAGCDFTGGSLDVYPIT